MWKLLTQIFGSRNQRLIKEMSRTVAAVNALEASVSALKDEEFPGKDPGTQGALRGRHAAR